MTDKRTPLDLAAVTLPVKAIAIDGALFAWQDGDPAWAGEWAFPSSGWSDAQRDSWITMNGTLIGVTREGEEILKAGDALATSPEFLLATKEAEIAEAVRTKEINERFLEGMKALTAARKVYGANIRHMRTVEGDIIIMVGMTGKETDGANAAAKMAGDQRLAADPNAKQAAVDEYVAMQKNVMLSKCVHPVSVNGDRSRIREIADMHPALWDDLFAMRNDMGRARLDDEGKGFAP